MANVPSTEPIRHRRAALLRKWLLIALVSVLLLVPLLVWVSYPGSTA